MFPKIDSFGDLLGVVVFITVAALMFKHANDINSLAKTVTDSARNLSSL